MRSQLQPSIWLIAGLVVMMVVCFQAQAIELFSQREEHGHGIFGTGGRPDKKTASAHMLQQEMMDFSDRYTMAIWQALDDYLRGETDPLKRSAAEQWKVIFSAASMEIAAEREPAGSLLDMAVLMDLADWAVNNYWVPEVFGPRGAPLIRAHKLMRRDFDVLLARTLTPAQREDLEGMIRSWKSEHPATHYVADIRLRDLAASRASKERNGGGIPLLADVSRAVGQMDTALQYGERLMFYVERVSRLTTMQTALALAQAGNSPSILSLTRSAESVSSSIEKLPDSLSSAMEKSTGSLKELLPGIQTTIADTRATAEAVERIQNSLASSPGDTPWTPEKTTALVTGLGGTAREWNATLQQVEKTISTAGNNEAPVRVLLAEAQIQARSTVDYAFGKTLLLVGLLLGGQLVLLLMAAWLFRGARNRG